MVMTTRMRELERLAEQKDRDQTEAFENGDYDRAFRLGHERTSLRLTVLMLSWDQS